MTARRNVLLIIADDQGKTLGCYGDPVVQTPNIDKLASQGAKFDLAFASTASCSGSRSVIHTGLHTHENGQYGIIMPECHFETWGHIDSGPRLFNEAGFLTGIIAKVHVGPKEVYPWTVREESGTRDAWHIANRCEAFFERSKAEERPFFLTAAFIDPHRDRSRGGFGNDEPVDRDHVKDIEVSVDDVPIPPWLSDSPETREELSEYYRAIYRFDQGVGFILDKLEKQGLSESTLVVVTSDNGPPFVNSKATLYDAGTCLPFIVRSPAATNRGIVNPNLVSYIDMLPTFLDWAGIPLDSRVSPTSPPRLGKSILPILDSASVVDEAIWQHEVYCSHTFHQRENYWPTRVIRERKYKYHRNIAWQLPFAFATDLYLSRSFEGIRNLPKPVYIGKRSLKDYVHRLPELLYDLEADPDEVRNLSQDPAYTDELMRMRKKLENWQMATGDFWCYKDGQSWRQINIWCVDEVDVPDRFDFDPERPGTRGQEDGLGMVVAGGADPDHY